MKILRIEFKNINIFSNGFVVDFVAKDRVVNTNDVYKFSSKFYTQNVISIIGGNASGKTTLLKLLNMCFSIVLNKKYLDQVHIPKGIVKDDSVMLVDFYDESSKKYYRLESVFGVNLENNKTKFVFKEEFLYLKNSKDIKNKDALSLFTKENIIFTREELRKEVLILRDIESIFLRIFDHIKEVYLEDLFMYENLVTSYAVQGNANMLDINIFDDSIEKMNLSDKQLSIKFKNSESEKKCSVLSFEDYLLSSGTSKGGELLSNIREVIHSGTYFIIDELENHFHKRLSEFIIELFNDESINKKGATLIFTTHYAEILDSIDRKDNIFICVRDDNYNSKLIKYSDEVKRIENKKSEVFLSNFIKGTSPSYSAIQKFKESIWD